ncbi:hypothetical protein TTHERM_000073161 (macronuclear) [Tetrahymena thermophila SB210]|uniref:Tetratricopeptide repeat protein n=1 Tax=Tetrahymena thermophila (strain SB210) TaxID=312017 RepID=W7XCW2_TETTS|nr:hypothetical protein TTHERM_000073161 [Tetrahymena thermophila SB210]EWS74418.1 hypothetical protein TTHERM_000073161 [Tetrahymena thermophila SB210]|eukprot:XP_012652995.1 hypothetical protein TTHERM_000073161 [Tetrahymena thermophila SB210]
MELDKTLQVLSYQMEQIQLMQRYDIYGEYKQQQMKYCFIAGDFIEVKIIADKMYEDFKQSLNDQLNLQQIKGIIDLADQLYLSNQYERGVDMILIAIKHLEKIQDKSVAAKDLSQAYLLCAVGYLTLKEYEIAAKYSEMSYQANKSTYQSLKTAYVSYKKLGLQDKAEEIYQILKGKISEDQLKEIEKNYAVFKQMFNFTDIYQQQADQILKAEAQLDQEDKNSGRKIIFNLDGEADRISNYFKNRNYEEGIKFYTNILGQLDPKFDFFRKLQDFDQALEYSKFVERYLDQFQQEEQYVEMYQQLINLRMNILSQLQDHEMIQKELEKFYQFLLPIKNQESHQFYVCLMNLINLFLKTNNNQGLVKYGQEYLKVRLQFEKEDDFLHNTCNVYFRLIFNYMNSKQFELANKLIVESQSYFLKQKDYSSLYKIHLFQISLDIHFNKYECVDNSIKNAENILSQYFVGHQDEKEMRSLGYFAISSSYLQIRDYQRSFEYFEKLVSLRYSSQKCKENQKYLIDNLLKIEGFKEKTENMIQQYGLNNESKQ